LPAGLPFLRLRFMVQNASIYSFMAGSNAALVEVPPVLGYARQDPDLVLSWPTNSAGYALEYATNLPTLGWNTAAPPPVIVGDKYVVTNTLILPDGSERYYRLQKP